MRVWPCHGVATRIAEVRSPGRTSGVYPEAILRKKPQNLAIIVVSDFASNKDGSCPSSYDTGIIETQRGIIGSPGVRRATSSRLVPETDYL